MPMDNLTIFVSSSDEYEDCWQPFFFLLKKFWPGCDLPIVLNTQSKSFSLQGLDILSTMVGKRPSFGETFHAGLEHVKTDNILLIMIDYFIMEDVRVNALLTAYKTFLDEKLDGLYLVEMKTITSTAPLADHAVLVTGPGPDRFSFQAALWKKSSIEKYILKHEDPWLAEYFGSLRYEFTGDRLGYVDLAAEPFKYLHTGALHKGGWIEAAVPELEKLGISLDWKKRGFYKWRQLSVGERLKKRKKTGLKEIQSRIHLLGLKAGLVKP